MKGEVIAVVAGKLSDTEVKMTQLTTEVAKQSKTSTDAATTLQGLLICVEI